MQIVTKSKYCNVEGLIIMIQEHKHVSITILLDVIKCKKKRFLYKINMMHVSLHLYR